MTTKGSSPAPDPVDWSGAVVQLRGAILGDGAAASAPAATPRIHIPSAPARRESDGAADHFRRRGEQITATSATFAKAARQLDQAPSAFSLVLAILGTVAALALGIAVVALGVWLVSVGLAWDLSGEG